MAHRSSAPDLPRGGDRPGDRWDRDRYEHERERERDRFSDRFSEIRERLEDEDDHYTRRGPSRGPPPPRERERDDRSSIGPPPRERERDDRSSIGPPPLDRDRDRDRDWRRRLRDDADDDDFVRDRRRVTYDDGPPQIIRTRPSPPPSEAMFRRRAASPPPDVERTRVTMERERERYRSPSPPRRPAGLLRRQSSLDTFDRKPAAKRYWEREEYGPPARRDDYRVPPPYVDIPLPRTKALPPPRVYAEREYSDEIEVLDPHRYGDEDFHAYPERVREKEVVRTRRRTRSRESRVRRRSRSSSSSSSSSSSGGTALTSRSEYPKRGKTRIPARLVSKRALIDLGYPFVEEVGSPFCGRVEWVDADESGQHHHRAEGSRPAEHRRLAQAQRRLQEE
jgi:hypothetical protein